MIFSRELTEGPIVQMILVRLTIGILGSRYSQYREILTARQQSTHEYSHSRKKLSSRRSFERALF
jgi:hypothetical protein